MPWQERFWAKVDRLGPTECWEWQASTADKGYGLFRKVAGPRVGEPDIKKLVATNQMWEARVKDSTGAYRMFFRFGKVGGRRIVAVAYGRKKSEQNFSRSVIDLAQKRVNAFLAELGADGFDDEDR